LEWLYLLLSANKELFKVFLEKSNTRTILHSISKKTTSWVNQSDCGLPEEHTKCPLKILLPQCHFQSPEHEWTII